MLKPLQAAGPLDHGWIARHIPHHGAMCLLDRVDSWDEQGIRCRSTSHRSADNPLRAGDRLGAACGIEYAAQAMAVHGALRAGPADEAPLAGYLVSARNVRLNIARLDDIPGDLLVIAHCVTYSETTSLYEFSIEANGQELVTGRALVAFDADQLETGSARSP